MKPKRELREALETVDGLTDEIEELKHKLTEEETKWLLELAIDEIVELEERLEFKSDVDDITEATYIGRIAELERQKEKNDTYFVIICEALDIKHSSSLTEILVAIEALKGAE